MINLQLGTTYTEEKFKLGSLNIGTLRGYAREVVETMTRRKVNICCVQKIGWSGASAWLITEKESKYKILQVGNWFALGGVKLLVARNWIDKIFDMECVNDRLMMIKLFIGKQILAVV